MELGGLFLLLLLLLLLTLMRNVSSDISDTFYGDSIHLTPPQRNSDGTVTVKFYSRRNGGSSCRTQSSFTCGDGECETPTGSSVVQTDRDDTGQGRWCQSEGHSTVTVKTEESVFTLRDSGCCWESNIRNVMSWTSGIQLHMGTRSDTKSINNCPVTTTVSSLRAPQNCFSQLPLLAYDPDGDTVRCRFSSDLEASASFTLDEAPCTLTRSGELQLGVHVLQVTLEDFPPETVTVTHTDNLSEAQKAADWESVPLCKVKLQFLVEITPPLPSCEVGRVQPLFLSKTPTHGEVRHAEVGETFLLYAEAQAHHSRITDFQVSGPQGMSKAFKNNLFGKAEVTLTWTPQLGDLHRSVPVCFTAETQEIQSEQRCVIVLVKEAVKGKTVVQCAANNMTVFLDKSSMPGIDVNFLKLGDSKCLLSSNSTHIVGTVSLTTCGTQMKEKEGFLIFSNEIISFELSSETITRRRKLKFAFSCKFPKALTLSNSFQLQKSDYIFTDSSFGSFSLAFEIFRDGNFTEKVEASEYPVEVMLMKRIYMGLEAQTELPNVTIFVESCKATPDDNAENSLFYDLIKNGCLKDETLKIHAGGQTEFKFEVLAFKFNDIDQVYITCAVILCDASSPFSRCAQGCLEAPSRRRRRDLNVNTKTHYITQDVLAEDIEDLYLLGSMMVVSLLPVLGGILTYHEIRRGAAGVEIKLITMQESLGRAFITQTQVEGDT